ncbi:transposon Tf2-9 polyprotein [Trichonephila clavipes]|nr:transposon Tf2-9 polyprotein [Trichonephila clavipes]
MGAVLTQLNEQGEEHPILYLSKKFSEVEKRYCTTEKECAGIAFAIKKLHYYLDGNSFLVMTDHNPLVWLNRNVSSNPRLMRWALTLQPYNFRIVHRSGLTISDPISRFGGGRGIRVVKVSGRGWPCHEFDPSTTKDPPCRAVMHVKSVESSNVRYGVIVWRRECQLRCRPRHLTMVQNYEVRRQKPSCS